MFKKYKHDLEWFNPSCEIIDFINKIAKNKYVEVVDGEVKDYVKMSK